MRRYQLAKHLLGLFIPPGTPICWQTVAERPDVKHNLSLTKQWTEPARSALPKLRRFNEAGASIFITVQETDGRGRKRENITRIRALFVDIEDKEPRDWHLEPTMIIATGKGRHAYWCVADDMPLDQFTEAQQRLIKRYDSDPAIHDLPRVMRVSGALHLKGEPYEVHVEHLGSWGMYPWREILRGLPEVPKAKPIKAINHTALRAARSFGAMTDFRKVDVTTLRLTEMFTDLGMARKRTKNGLAVICPWADSHSSDTAVTATMVFDGDGQRPAGFKCLHAHCADRTLSDVLRLYKTHVSAYGKEAPSRAALRAASYLSSMED